MSLYDSFSTNKDKEDKGVPIKYAPNKDGTEPTFYVARQSNRNAKFRKVNKQLFEPYRQKFKTKSIKDEELEELGLLGFVKGCLRGWANIQDRNGVEIPFSEQAAMRLFEDLPDLLEDLMEKSTDISNFRDEIVEEDAKN